MGVSPCTKSQSWCKAFFWRCCYFRRAYCWAAQQLPTCLKIRCNAPTALFLQPDGSQKATGGRGFGLATLQHEVLYLL